MGSVWVHDLPAFMQKHDIKFNLYPDWEIRSRSTGGYEEVRAIGIHDTGAGANSSAAGEMNWMWNGSPDRPIGAMHIARNGTITLGAAGATNTQGRGGPVVTTKGVIPKDRGNLYMFSIEASSNPYGWPEAQVTSYIRVAGVLCKYFELEPLTDILTHWAWCQPSVPGRKTDPQGATPSHPNIGGVVDSRTWSDWHFNSAAKEAGQDEMNLQYVKYRVDSRKSVGKIGKNSILTVLRPPGVPSSAKAAFVNVALNDTAGRGFANAYPGDTLPPQESCVNSPGAGWTGSGFTLTKLAPNGSFVVFTSVEANIIVDVKAYVL